jgi:hypothetical protein
MLELTVELFYQAFIVNQVVLGDYQLLLSDLLTFFSFGVLFPQRLVLGLLLLLICQFSLEFLLS